MRCQDCRYWMDFGLGPDGRGACHRYAPSGIDVDNSGDAVWPATGGDDFCGDFAKDA